MTEQNKPFYEKFVKKTETKFKRQNHLEKEFDGNLHQEKKDIKLRKDLAPIKIIKTQNTGKNIFKQNNPQTNSILNSFDIIIKDALKLSAKQEASIPKDIRILFHELTNERSSRKINYLNNPVKLTAYIYHYMWWNLVRISKLIANLNFDLNDGDIIADFGCGPMTMACAFWIAKPELRSKKLHWYCVDISNKALSVGEALFNSLCNFTSQSEKLTPPSWKITKVNGSFGTSIKNTINLFLSANMFNEIFWDSSIKVEGEAEKAAKTILHYLKKDSTALVIEPGIPLAGEFISSLRKNFIKENSLILSPCPHHLTCPIPGSRPLEKAKEKFLKTGSIKYPIASDKWCHFSFYADDAPEKLIRLSEAAKLEKTRASLSFLYCKIQDEKPSALKAEIQKKEKEFYARISSEIIKLSDGRIGRYACSEKGFLLLTEKKSAKSKLNEYIDGSLIKIEDEKMNKFLHDKKTGALVINV